MAPRMIIENNYVKNSLTTYSLGRVENRWRCASTFQSVCMSACVRVCDREKGRED